MREKLIELAHDYFDSVPWYADIADLNPEELIDHLITNGVTIQKWIPVTERLPEEWKDVLVLLRFGCCETAVYLGVPGKWRVTWYRDMIGVDSVTHWMPLPEPPNGERRTDDERTGIGHYDLCQKRDGRTGCQQGNVCDRWYGALPYPQDSGSDGKRPQGLLRPVLSGRYGAAGVRRCRPWYMRGKSNCRARLVTGFGS